ncbi:hypothetical protein [Mycobacterium sp. PS03-16]|uniref:hypothetical protein n=1 Tax=Mycobacterium sp. PS03-16 TaxID=2559611 RepID=UPI001FD7BA2F|nr:hypothetical protein [Mycobacterium sp. PS03-16]
MPHSRNTLLTRGDAQDDGTPDSVERKRDALAARALAEEAEAQAAEALAAAAQARARAARLRERADGLTTHDAVEADDVAADEPTVGEADDDADEPAGDEERPEAVVAARRRFPRTRWGTVVLTLTLLCTAAFSAAGAYVVWQHREAVAHQQQSAEYAAAARQIVFTLMSIDAAKAKDNVAQILDNSTGEFHDEFAGAAEDFVKLAQDGQVVTDVNVKAAAVEKMAGDTAEVLVTATSTVTNAAGADKQPRMWRLSVTVVRDGDRLKMSKMEFVA